MLAGCLYAIGGHDGPMVRRSVERYDPLTKAWECVADMVLCRRNAGSLHFPPCCWGADCYIWFAFTVGVVTHDGLIYVVGGDDGTANLNSAEVYNSSSNTWTVLPSCMGIGRSYAGVAVINRPF